MCCFFGKKIRDTVPVLIHKGFKDTNEELLVILHSNIGRKLSEDETDRISSEIIRIDSEMYPTKQSRPKGETKRALKRFLLFQQRLLKGTLIKLLMKRTTNTKILFIN